jgi:hypothetical protein
VEDIGGEIRVKGGRWIDLNVVVLLRAVLVVNGLRGCRECQAEACQKENEKSSFQVMSGCH